MRRDARAYLWDAKAAVDAIERFTRGKSFEDFAQDDLLRSAVERQFEIVGEALSQLAKNHPEVAAKIPDLRRIIGFRNILVHGYAIVDHGIVWRAIHENLPDLRSSLDARLGGEGPIAR